jgi:hypothetical protein
LGDLGASGTDRRVLLLAVSVAANPDALVFECTALQFQNVGRDGRLQETDWTRRWMEIGLTFLFVTSDGSMRRNGSDLGRFRIVQRATRGNDLVAAGEFFGPARQVLHVFRVRAWATPDHVPVQ